MTKQKKSIYVCQSCGYQTLKWMGRCPDCDQWNSIVEEAVRPKATTGESPVISRPQSIDSIILSPEMRLTTDFSEFDRTLGGGIVPGSLVLIGGDPGIGKSTLILQVLDRLARKDCRTVYLSGEESLQQIKLRAERLSVNTKGLYVVTGTCIEAFFEEAKSLNPFVVAVDSIQTMYTNEINSAPGSLGQVREVASQLMAFAKQNGVSIFVIGHVTKEGAIAGPKVLEHMVDTVLYFEGDRGHAFRILRAVKNRYGSTNEIGVFEMKDAGLTEVENPSRIFLQERPCEVPGSVVVPCIEGTRPLLVEVQALVGRSPLGMPRRTAVGVDHNRISLLVAVLGKRLGMELGDQDIFVNVAGGLKIDEPAADLAIVSAMMSSFLNRPLDRRLAVFGEVGLGGEVRGVSRPGLRISEARKLGFSRCILSVSNMEESVSYRHSSLTGVASGSTNRGTERVEFIAVETIQELYDQLFNP